MAVLFLNFLMISKYLTSYAVIQKRNGTMQVFTKYKLENIKPYIVWKILFSYIYTYVYDVYIYLQFCFLFECLLLSRTHDVILYILIKRFTKMPTEIAEGWRYLKGKGRACGDSKLSLLGATVDCCRWCPMTCQGEAIIWFHIKN